jgi:hypothetical protein
LRASLSACDFSIAPIKTIKAERFAVFRPVTGFASAKLSETAASAVLNEVKDRGAAAVPSPRSGRRNRAPLSTAFALLTSLKMTAKAAATQKNHRLSG